MTRPNSQVNLATIQSNRDGLVVISGSRLLWLLFLCSIPCVFCGVWEVQFASAQFAPPGRPVPIPPGVPPGTIPVPVQPVAPAVNLDAMYQGELHFEVSEGLLKQLLTRSDTTSGPVKDFIAGAAVEGLQTTQTKVDIDCVPSEQGAKFAFVMTGVVESTTTARTPQAEVLHQGNSQFYATKGVLLNGESLLTQQAIIRVLPNQQVKQARSPQGRLPIFGRLADRIVYNMAVAKTNQSNLQAGQKLLSRLQPQLDGRIDEELAVANRTLKSAVWDRLQQADLVPKYRGGFSSDDRLCFDYRFGENNVRFVQSSILPPVADSLNDFDPVQQQDGLEIHLYDRLLNQMSQRFSVAGQVVSITELQEKANQMLRQLLTDDPPALGKLPLDIDFEFAQSDPMNIQFNNQFILVEIRGSFQAGTLPKTNLQRIIIKISNEFTPGTWTLRTTSVDVYEEGRGGELLEPGITQTAVATQLRAQLVPLTFPRQIPLPLEKFPGKKIQVNGVESGNGWLVVRADLVDSGEVIPPGITPVPELPTIPGPTFVPAP